MQDFNKILAVSIAAYQVENTIEECLDSFLKSKHLQELELLVINDGSTDRTVEIVSRYEEKYPGVIKLVNKKNGGHGSTINKSLSIATGKFYKILDGDDWVDAQELDKLVDYLKVTQADLVINRCCKVYPTYTQIIEEDEGYEFERVYQFSELFLDNNIGKHLFSMHGTTILTERLREVKMQILENCFYADTMFIYYVGLAARTVAFHNSCAYQYRLGTEGQSVSAAGVYKHVEDLIKIERRLVQIYKTDCQKVEDSKRLGYIFAVLDTRYNMLFDWFTGIITCSDKDYLMLEFVNEMKSQHKDIVNLFHLSIYNRIVEINPKFFMPVFRMIRSSFVWSIIRKLKKCFCGRNGGMKVID